MDMLDFCRRMPKVELHVHLEGSIRPETVLRLSRKHGIALPGHDLESLHDWYRFRDFRHFVEVYIEVSKCIRTPEDVEFVAREFLEGQAAQNVLHSEVTYTACTIERFNGIPWPDQLAALQSAMAYGERELGVTMSLILDIVRGTEQRAEDIARATLVAEWAVSGKDQGVCALGIAGVETTGTFADYADAFRIAREAGLPIVPHAGETCGAPSIWGALEECGPARIGHGVRCMEDPSLVDELRRRQIPLEVCPTSNVSLNVFPSLAEHPLPRMLDEGLYITVNSDDPPMFGTSISEEFARCAEAFQFNEDILWTLCLNAARAALLDDDRKAALVARMREEFGSSGEDAAKLPA